MATVLSMLQHTTQQSQSFPQPPIAYAESHPHPQQTSHQPLSAFIPHPTPRYLYKYPQVSDAIQTMHTLISEWKPPTAQGSYELECRFGTWQGQYFHNGVSRAFVEKILSMFETFPQWSKVTDWEETHDYYYSNGSDPTLPMVRTTASFKTDSKTGRKHIVTEHIRKYTRSKMDFQYHGSPTEFRYDIRVGLNYEEKVSDQELPSIVNPSSVRIKSRKSFYYKSEDFPSSEPLWRFDITRSWNGLSRSEAEIKQRNGETTFEVELECLNPRALMVSPKHDSFYVACSMMLKMKDFLTYPNQTDFKWEPIQRPQPAHDVECF